MDPKTIVVPLDGSEFAERALPVAKAIADRIGGGLLLVSASYRGPLHPHEYLDEVTAHTGDTPVALVAAKEGQAADVIIEAIGRAGDHVVCMTSHGHGRPLWSTLGSVAESVIRRTSRPALLVGRSCRADFLDRSSHLLACTDGSDDYLALAPVAQAWAAMLDLDLRVVTVRHPLDVDSAERVDAILQSMVQSFGASDIADATIVRSGYPPAALADFAEDLPAALIGMNCHSRAGFSRLTLGSVTMSVLQHASCPVLVTHNPIEVRACSS